MRPGTASRTAVLTCQGRAVATALGDPTAFALLREDERAAVRRVQAGEPPAGFGERLEYEQVRACGEVMLPRTLVIDAAIRARATGHPPDGSGGPAARQVVILGSGLDGRAWRMPELAGCVVLEVDHPDSQRDKQERLGSAGLAPVAQVLFVPVDLARDRLDRALATADHQPGEPTIWVWEGVIAYLRRAAVRDTVATLSALSAPGSRLVANYEAPSTAARAGRLLVRALGAAARRRAVTADEPRRSAWTPAALGALVGGHGFTVAEDRDLATAAVDLGLQPQAHAYLRSSRVLVADRR